MQRELTIVRGDITHPQHLPDGSVAYVDAGIRERLQGGDATRGWEGDPRLEVYLGPDKRLYVWRLENGEYHVVCRSRPGMPLDDRLIDHLISGDTRRGYNPHDAVTANNAALDKAAEEAADAKSHEASSRLAHGLRRDLGHLYS